MTIEDFFRENNKIAIAFSGGVDSSYLLYEAGRCGADVKAYYVNAQFQPEFELEDAKKLAKEVNVAMEIIEVDVLKEEKVVQNPPNRCYYCKNAIFSTIIKKAKEDGYDLIADGTNASDDAKDRPGMKALEEMKVLSPLKICGLTKDEIRKRSKEAGLFTWNKPSYACLATRIKTGQRIDEETLKKVEVCEGFMMDLGFSDFRIRVIDNNAKIQIKEDDVSRLLKERKQITDKLKNYFDDVLLDLAVFR